MATIHLIRTSRNNKAVRGTATIPIGADIARATTQYDSQPRCSNESSSCSRSPQELEIIGDPNERIEIATLENSDYIIPEGKYELQNTMSPKFKKILPLVCSVPKRSGIRIHTGTKPEHSTGCVLVSAFGKQQIIDFINQKAKQNEKVYLSITADL